MPKYIKTKAPAPLEWAPETAAVAAFQFESAAGRARNDLPLCVMPLPAFTAEGTSMGHESDTKLDRWISREAVAEAMIPLIGTLYRDHQVVTSIHGRRLINKSAIGVDSDQYNVPAYSDVKDVIITSMLKRVDVAVFDYINAVAAGDTSKLPAAFDLTVDGVGYATSGGKVDDIKADLDAYKAAIISGQISVPSTK